MAKKEKGSIGFGVSGSAKGRAKKKRGPGKPFQPGNPYRIQPGQVLNPLGVTRRPITAVLEQLAEQNPEAVLAIGTHMFDAAQGLVPFCNGAVMATKFITERLEGAPLQRVAAVVANAGQIDYGDRHQNAARIRELIARAAERANRRGTN